MRFICARVKQLTEAEQRQAGVFPEREGGTRREGEEDERARKQRPVRSIIVAQHESERGHGIK